MTLTEDLSKSLKSGTFKKTSHSFLHSIQTLGIDFLKGPAFLNSQDSKTFSASYQVLMEAKQQKILIVGY